MNRNSRRAFRRGRRLDGKAPNASRRAPREARRLFDRWRFDRDGLLERRLGRRQRANPSDDRRARDNALPHLRPPGPEPLGIGSQPVSSGISSCRGARTFPLNFFSQAPKLHIVLPCLIEAELPVRTTSNLARILIVLPVILPEARRGRSRTHLARAASGSGSKDTRNVG
jgi:hypothetical protein